MTGEHPDGIDLRLHAYLDGEMTAAELQSFERELATSAVLRQQLTALRELEGWLEETRPQASPGLAASVVAAIQADGSAEVAGADSRDHGRNWSWSSWRESWAWLVECRPWNSPGVALAAILLVMLCLSGRVLLPPTGTFRTARSTESSDDLLHPGADANTPISFHLTAPAASSVCLVGNFNQWMVCDTALRRDASGAWIATVELPPGRHEYMFVVDGEWVADPGADLLVDDGFGNLNAVLIL